MSGNSIGTLFRVTTFGESHGEALGAVIDGMPAGLAVSLDDLKVELKRRAPGQHEVHTGRKEDDLPEILSGVFENKTTGTPITVIVRNTNQRSDDYKDLKTEYRPGHADETTMIKYGFRDHRGGGRSSGRETLARVIGGYFAGLILKETKFYAYIEQVAHFKLSKHPEDFNVDRGEINIPDQKMTADVKAFLLDCKSRGESAGGIVSLSVFNPPTALGEPVFDKLKADLSKVMMSIPASLAFSMGDGFEMALKLGSEISADRKNFSGIEGGISNGETIRLKVAFKAPSTIGKKALSGRHDPCILPRVIPVVEAMAKIILADHFLRQTAYAPFVPSKTNP